MNRFVLPIIFTFSSSLFCMQICKIPLEAVNEKAEEKKITIYEDEFTLDNVVPMYVGYKNPLSKKQIELSENQFNRTFAPDELLLTIQTAKNKGKIINSLTDRIPYQEKEYTKLGCSNLYPYNEIKNLNEGDTIEFLSPNGQPVKLTVKTPKSTNPMISTFQNMLIALLIWGKKEPSFFMYDSEKLVENGILCEKYDRFFHGPNGFDFSILDARKKEKQKPILKEKK